MANPSKAKGTRFEVLVANYLKQYFPRCERRALRGINDGGDLAGLPLTVECKATKSLDPATALNEAKRAAEKNGDHLYAAVLKRRMKPVSEAYAVVPLWILVELLMEDS